MTYLKSITLCDYNYTLDYLHSMNRDSLGKKCLLENFEEEVGTSIASCGQLIEEFEVRHHLV